MPLISRAILVFSWVDGALWPGQPPESLEHTEASRGIGLCATEFRGALLGVWVFLPFHHLMISSCNAALTESSHFMSIDQSVSG